MSEAIVKAQNLHKRFTEGGLDVASQPEKVAAAIARLARELR